MFCALLGQDIRLAFTGPLVLWFFICDNLLQGGFQMPNIQDIIITQG